jgi:hypothetical protein
VEEYSVKVDRDPGLVRGKSPDPDKGPEPPTDEEIKSVFDETRFSVSAGTKYLDVYVHGEGGFMARGEEILPVLDALTTNDLVVRVNAHPKSGCNGRAALDIIEKWRERAADAAMKMRESERNAREAGR